MPVKSIRLNNNLRHQIIQKAVDSLHTESRIGVRTRMSALFFARALETNPHSQITDPNWLFDDPIQGVDYSYSSIAFYAVDGAHEILLLSLSTYVPIATMRDRNINIKMTDPVDIAIVREYTGMTRDKKHLRKFLSDLLRQITTTKRLVQVWPPGEQFLPDEVTATTVDKDASIKELASELNMILVNGGVEINE